MFNKIQTNKKRASLWANEKKNSDPESKGIEKKIYYKRMEAQGD